MRTLIISFAMLAVLAPMDRPASADNAFGQHCCDNCGCPCDCLQKTCQLVCELKKEKKTCWCVETKEFCTLLPGCPHLCDCCPDLPHCGRSKCVKVLVKREYEEATPIYKCEVRYLCPACRNGGQTNTPSAEPGPQPAPAAPAPPAQPMPAPPTI